MVFVASLLWGCGGAPEPAPIDPEPRRAEVPKPVEIRAPLTDPNAVDPATAAPRQVESSSLTGGVPDALKVLYHARGDGDIEPCGCPRLPAGGLARRRTVIEDQRAGSAAILLEGGESLVRALKGAEPTGQDRAKARLIASEWVEAGISAAAVGPSEWALGRGMIEDLVKEGYPVTAANLICEGGVRPFPAARVFEHGARKVAVVGLTEGEVEGCVVTDPAEAAAETFAQLEAMAPDVTVLLWPTREDHALNAARLDGLAADLVIDATGGVNLPNAPTRAGTSWVLGVGQQTKSLGAIAIEFVAATPGLPRPDLFPVDYEAGLVERENRIAKRKATLQKTAAESTNAGVRRAAEINLATLEAERAKLAEERASWSGGGNHRMLLTDTMLTDKVADHAETAARVAKVKAGFSELDDASGAEILARPMRAPEGSPYAGTVACTQCHPTQYNQWRGTGHAKAMSALIRADRHFDEECWSCHVTGAEPAKAASFPVVLQGAREVGGLLNVQCEACHGPGAAHAKDPTKVDLVKDTPQSTCVGCHDGVRDGGRFDFESYLPKVAHPDE